MKRLKVGDAFYDITKFVVTGVTENGWAILNNGEVIIPSDVSVDAQKELKTLYGD